MDCISAKVQNKLSEDIEQIEMWNRDAHRILEVSKKLDSPDL